MALIGVGTAGNKGPHPCKYIGGRNVPGEGFHPVATGQTDCSAEGEHWIKQSPGAPDAAARPVLKKSTMKVPSAIGMSASPSAIRCCSPSRLWNLFQEKA